MTDGRKSTTAKTTKQGAEHQQKITRKKELFLLFWVNEEDRAKKLFQEVAQTRLVILKTEPWYNAQFHKVHCPDIKSFSQIQTSIDYWVNYYGGSDSVAVKEISFFSHSARQGPIIYNAYKHDSADLLIQIDTGRHQQMKLECWKNIRYYWSASENNRLNFFGCNSAKGGNDSFAAKISTAINCLNVTVSGQPQSSYPSFYPDCRYTTAARSMDIGWDLGPTYMIASEGGNGKNALQHPPNQAITHKMVFYRNSLKTLEAYQSAFNDHRKSRNQSDSAELRKIGSWQRGFKWQP